jgi:glutathione S-transferase
MTDITLHFAPDTCARVPMTALEEIGIPFKTELVAFMRGDHRSPGYLALNPKGKVPTLCVEGHVLTENVAILSWLATAFPDAHLLPRHSDPFDHAGVVSDLAFCASLLHPIVTRLRIPQYFCDIEDAIPRVFAMAEQAMRPNFALIDQRLSVNKWWYGDRWSIVDAYINWVWFRVAGTAFDVSPYCHFARHDNAAGRRPAIQRALRRDAEAAKWLAERGLEVKFSGGAPVRVAAL